MDEIKQSGSYKRRVKDHWYVQYEEAAFPAVQKGWVLPPERWADFDPFILMAEDWFKRGTFSDHPHRGFQTITYVIDGRLEHIDNGGGRDILEPGDVQYMNAGWAARHAEEAVDEGIAHTLQLWLNLPASLKHTKTEYQNIYADQAPSVSFEGGSIKVFSGETDGVKGPLESLVPVTMFEISLEAGAEYNAVLPGTDNAFLYVLSGDMDFGHNEVNLKMHGAALLDRQESEAEAASTLRIKANARHSRMLVYSGHPIKEELVQYGPFVMNTMDEIKQAFSDFRDGKFGPPAV